MRAYNMNTEKENNRFFIVIAFELIAICAVFVLCVKFFYDRHIKGAEGVDIRRNKITAFAIAKV